MPLTSIEDASKTDYEGAGNYPSESVSQQGVAISKFRDNDLDYSSMFPSLNDNSEEPGSRIGDKIGFQQEDLANDPYHDDDVLQERVDNKSRSHIGPGIRGEPIRRQYDYGSYSALNRAQGDSYGGLPMHNPNDYAYPMGDRHTPSMNMPNHYGHSSMPGNDAYEDGLFIEAMPTTLPDVYSSYGIGETYGESLVSPHPHSPAPFDRPPRQNSYYREDEFTPDLHRSSNNYSYSSLSYLRDGGVGIGRNFSQNHLNEDYWPRTHSVSSNMNSMGFSSYPYNRASYLGLRSSHSHSRQQISEMGPDYDMNYPAHIAPHRVSSMERIPDYRGLSGGFRERDSDIPMSRARSMIYFGEDDGMDPYYPMKTVSRENSYQNFGGLEPVNLLESTEPRGVMLPTKRVSPSVLLETENTTPITDSPVENTSPRTVEEQPAKQEAASASPLSNPAKGPVKSTSPPPAKSEWRSHNSPSPTPGKSRSPRPLDEDKKHNKYKFPCRDFENGVCSRGAACKFYHDPSKGTLSIGLFMYSCHFSRCLLLP